MWPYKRWLKIVLKNGQYLCLKKPIKNKFNESDILKNENLKS